MAMKKSSQPKQESDLAFDERIERLSKVAFGNILDFARFEADGSVQIFDWNKAEEVGAKVSVVTRTRGRGRNAREVRITKIRMPDKVKALCKLLDHLLSPSRRR
jgi:hypothetical protein